MKNILTLRLFLGSIMVMFQVAINKIRKGKNEGFAMGTPPPFTENSFIIYSISTSAKKQGVEGIDVLISIKEDGKHRVEKVELNMQDLLDRGAINEDRFLELVKEKEIKG